MNEDLLKELEAKAYVMNGGSFDARGWTRCFAQVVAEDVLRSTVSAGEWHNSKMFDAVRAKYGIK